jgi:acetyl esterase/lipase
MNRQLVRFLALVAVLVGPVAAPAQDASTYSRKEDVIYGRKFGTALTMDVFTPKEKANGLGLIFCVSGGWFSSHEAINAAFVTPFLKRGYTVFAVVHGSQPRFTVPEILEDMHRATRFVRAHAKDYQVDPDRLGIYGGSAGGHLSLMQGTAGKSGDPAAKDPLDRVSSRVQCVACFFPPTDFLNWEREGDEMNYQKVRNPFKPALAFTESDKDTRMATVITDAKKITETMRQISPIYHVTKESAPSLLIHGDQDNLVPIRQAKVFVEKLKTEGVPAELVVREGADHGWPTIAKDLDLFADWFDKHLKKAEK